MNETANIFNEINAEGVADVCEDLANSSGKGFIGKLVCGLVTLGAGVGAVVYAKRDVIKERGNNRKIKKLEKQGYIVTAPEVEVEDEVASREDETK